jgi:signal transduction histidine kinase
MLVDVSPRIQADITRPMPDEDIVQNALMGSTSTGSLKTLGDHKFLTAVTPLIDTNNHVTGLLVVEVEAEFFDVLDQFDRGLLIFSILNIILILSVAFYLFRSIRRVFFLQNQIKNQEHLVKLGEMAASVAHELRNPLGIMKGTNSLIQKKYGSANDELFTYIPTELDRLNKLIEDFLIFARTRELSIQSVDLKNLLNKICVGYSTLGDIKFSIDIPDDFPIIDTDPDTLEQIFLNVLTNSIQALSGAGEIKIKCEIRKNRCFISISDNGNGIAAENIDQIFEPFFTTKKEGSGLGLSISRRLIDQLNGNIHITSEPTKGTDVLIELPG